jgi:SprT protein
LGPHQKVLSETAKTGKVERMKGIPDALSSQAERWAELWGLPGLTESVTVEFSSRFRSSLGLCRPVQGGIRLAAHLANGNGDLLAEVLCHELAHVAAYRLHGRRIRPHGREWKSLVAAAGFEPRARFQTADAKFPPRSRKPRARWEHRCPVCHATRVAGRPVRNWRCVKCRRAGLSGKLIITRIPANNLLK